MAAITQSGAKRDYVDLFHVLRDTPFIKVARAIEARYGSALSSVAVGKALVFFDDAENDPEPAYIGPAVKWETVKRFFIKHVRQFVLDLEAVYSDSERPG